MNLYNQFKTNKDNESKGIFVSYGDEGDPEFLIARMGGANK